MRNNCEVQQNNSSLFETESRPVPHGQGRSPVPFALSVDTQPHRSLWLPFFTLTYLPFPSQFPRILRCFCAGRPDQPVPFYSPILPSGCCCSSGSAWLAVPESHPVLIPPPHRRSGCFALPLALESAYIPPSCRGSLSHIPPYGTTSLHFIAWKISR